MPTTNSWLCMYAIAQIGRPYWYATSGQISSVDLYTNTVLPALKRDYLSLYTNYSASSQLNKKVHDCSGLVVGALTCNDVNGIPSGTSPVAHGATSQFNNDCDKKSNSMSDFPYIPGTLVFVKNGNIKSHVGIYIGTYVDKMGKEHLNTVVEAANHASGVIVSVVTNNKWGAWGQLSCCTIDTSRGMKFSAKDVASGYVYGNPQSMIDAKKLRPFVVTVLGERNPKIDYDKLKDARVSAMMFFGGELYTAAHIKRSAYMNPYLGELVHNCSSAGLHYALYVNVRARTEIEADEECRILYYLISRYPPTLGLWLSVQTNTSVEMTDKILEVYYKYMLRWGISARCGLYVTPEQLSRLTWNSFKDRFYLWQIDPMDVNDVDDELLQPEMFEVPD